MVAVIRGTAPAGDGAGYGDGSGYGYGYGDGSGYGSGDGSGDGDGDGDGYGYGDGSGDGDGAGYGYGYGDGYGDGDYWRATIPYFVQRWPAVQQARFRAVTASGARIAFWRSAEDGTSANGGRCAPVRVGDVHREAGPLRDECGHGQLHATLLPPKWQGPRWWIVALIGEVRGSDEKYWALEREILGECV